MSIHTSYNAVPNLVVIPDSLHLLLTTATMEIRTQDCLPPSLQRGDLQWVFVNRSRSRSAVAFASRDGECVNVGAHNGLIWQCGCAD
jgi:hypothetical protein